nr:MAG TPA: PGDYG protein [Caudoviricetes sp.]
MLHKYNLKKPVEAEQFDGSEEMMDRYPISIGTDELGTWYKILTVEGLHLLDKGDWIISENGDYLVIERGLFRQIYERCD